MILSFRRRDAECHSLPPGQPTAICYSSKHFSLKIYSHEEAESRTVQVVGEAMSCTWLLGLGAIFLLPLKVLHFLKPDYRNYHLGTIYHKILQMEGWDYIHIYEAILASAHLLEGRMTRHERF